jgi:hypothetical protein
MGLEGREAVSAKIKIFAKQGFLFLPRRNPRKARSGAAGCAHIKVIEKESRLQKVRF